MYYIFNKIGQAIATANTSVDESDLSMRDETVVESNQIYDITAIELVAGEIVPINQTDQTAQEIQMQQLLVLDAQYKSQFDQIKFACMAAMIEENSLLITELKEEYTELKVQYDTERQVIIND